MKSFAKIAFVGFSGVVLFKLFATILVPLLGLFLGLLALTMKLALIAAVCYFIYSLVAKKKNDVEVGEIHEDAEIEVES